MASMPTSGTGISSRRIRSRAAGFSLLELLVVLVIIAVFFGAVVLSMSLAGDARDVEREAQRLGSLIGLVQEEAVMQSRDYGLLFSADEYRFYVYDHAQRQWIAPPGDNLLAAHALPADWRLDLRVEDRALALPRFEERESLEEPEPQVTILSSGEVTPFEAVVRRERDDTSRRLVAALDGDVEIESDDAALD